jgi:hypothetical protein
VYFSEWAAAIRACKPSFEPFFDRRWFRWTRRASAVYDWFQLSQENPMTALVLKGTKEEIAQQVASLEREVVEVIVIVKELSTASIEPVPATVEEFFKEMEPYTVNVGHVDDSREAIYTRREEE